ncbi:3-dehydroquinate synthase [bacterium]|nr:3-dehydroquinate synthase [bacterium]
MKNIKVNLGERSYAIYIDAGLLKNIGNILTEAGVGHDVVVITNPKVGYFYKDILVSQLKETGFETRVIEIPDGEDYKNLKTVAYLYDKLVEMKAHRKTTLIALGGGVIGDIVGFVAATFMRGIPFVQIPTTLLAQVDSSVGGKTGVNLTTAKNMVGAFWQPQVVIIDPDVLKTLSLREIKSGLAEVIKYGMIHDADFFEYLEKNIQHIERLESEAMIHIIDSSCKIKAEVVESDEREAGLRAILNFGHTIGHALESQTSYQLFRHGEAISIGMAAAVKIAARIGMFPRKDVTRLITLLQMAGLPVKFKDLSPDDLLQTMFSDKKNVSSEHIRFILPKRIGHVIMVEDLSQQVIVDILKEQKE